MKRVLVIGGYGAVGRHLVGSIARMPDMRITVAGRDGNKAAAVAAQVGGNVRGIRLDVLDVQALAAAVRESEIVVSCTEQNLPAIADVALGEGRHFTAVAASPHILRQLAARDELARRSGASGLIGVGLAPGIATLLARNLVESGTECDELSIMVELDALDSHGKEAIAWTLDQAAQAAGSVSLAFRGRQRRGVPVAFDDLHALSARLGVEQVESYLVLRPDLACRVLPLAGRTMRALAKARPKAYRLACGLAAKLATAGGRLQVGGRVQVGAMCNSSQRSDACWMTGRDQSLITGVVAGEAVRWLCSAHPRSGMRYFDEVVSLDALKAPLHEAGCCFQMAGARSSKPSL